MTLTTLQKRPKIQYIVIMVVYFTWNNQPHTSLIKAFHIIFMVTWFSGLFYLPRLFVYHANTEDELGYNRFVTMERKLYYYITLSRWYINHHTGMRHAVSTTGSTH